jgi:hypothetical protein
MTSPDAERRAFDLLQWVPFSLPVPFDPELAEQGHYTALQKARSDAALDAWDKAHPHETSTELAAFHELERLGIYSQAVFYSPAKAKDGYYTRRLRDHLSTSSAPRASKPAQPGRRARRRRPL